MGSFTGDYSQSPLTVLDEEKRYVLGLARKGRPRVDADHNLTALALFNEIRRLEQALLGSGVPAGGTGFQVIGTGAANDVTIKGGGGTGDSAGRLWLEGLSAVLYSDVAFASLGATDGELSVHQRSTGLTPTVLSDTAAQYVVNELVGRALVPNIVDGTQFTILSNTATTITVTVGDMTAVAAAGDPYRVEMRTPVGGGRTDSVWLNLWIDEIDELEDPGLLHNIPPLVPFAADYRAKIIQSLFVQEGVGARPDYVDADGRQHYLLKLATITRFDGVASIAAPDVVDDRPTITVPGSSSSTTIGRLEYNCPVTVVVNDQVYMSGALTVDRAQADTDLTARVVGFVVEKPTPTTCVVAVGGRAPAPGAGFTVGGPTGGLVFLSDTVPGGVTQVAPTTVGSIRTALGVADSADSFLFRVPDLQSGLIEVS